MLKAPAVRSVIDGIDHVMIIVDDAQASGSVYEKLGFVVQPLGSHADQGTSNRLIILDDTYIELMAVDYPTTANGVYSAFQATGGGLKSLAMRTPSAHAALDHWNRSDAASQPAVHFRRPVEIDGRMVTASFQIAFLDAEREPGVGIFVCEHETPQYVYRKAWSGHANTAKRVGGITIVARSVEDYETAARIAYGPESEIVEIAGGRRIRTGASFIDYIAPDAFADRFGGIPLPETTRRDLAAAMTLEVESPMKLIGLLEANSVPHIRQDDRVIVPASAAANVVLAFVPATTR